MKFRILFITTFILAFFFSYRPAYAVTVCGLSDDLVDLFPVNSGSPNPMKMVYATPSSSSYACSTDELKRVFSNPIPLLTWKPQVMNRGTQDYNLTYRIVFNRLANGGIPNACVSDWNTLDSPSTKFPQFTEGYSPTYNETITRGPGGNGSPKPWPFGPAKELVNTFNLQSDKGGVLPNGWYQIDVQPGCRWGPGPNDINWESKSIGAAFVNIGCQVPNAPQNLTATVQTDLTGKNSVVLNWNPPTPPSGYPKSDITSYNVYKYNNATGTYNILVGSVNANTTTFTDNNSGAGLACSNPSASPNPGVFSYKVGAVGCNNGTLSAAVNATTPVCPPPPCVISASSACANANQPKELQILNPANQPMQTSFWTSSLGSFFTQIPGTKVWLKPNNVSNTTNGTVTYNDTKTTCSAGGVVYPNGSVQFDILEANNGCSNTAPANGISGISVNYNDTNGLGLPNPVIPNQTNGSGKVNISGIYLRNQNVATCDAIGYKVNVAVGSLSNYNICNTLCSSGSNNCWARVGNFWVYTIPNINAANKDLTIPSLVFEKVPVAQRWLNINQGNMVVNNGDVTLNGTSSDIVIDNSGSIYASGNIDIGSASLGGTASNVYKIKNYVNTDNAKFIDVLLSFSSSADPNIDFIGPNGVSNNCENFSTTSTKAAVFANNCNLEIKSGSYAGTNLPTNYKIVIVKGGTLTFNKNINAVTASFITEGNIIFEPTATTSTLSVNGFVWTKQGILLGRKVDITTGLEYIKYQDLNNLLSTEAIHTLSYD